MLENKCELEYKYELEYKCELIFEVSYLYTSHTMTNMISQKWMSNYNLNHNVTVNQKFIELRYVTVNEKFTDPNKFIVGMTYLIIQVIYDTN